MELHPAIESPLVINEIFHSIQGESTHAGRPCVFIRLTYCNLRCSYCDTAYAFDEGQSMTVGQVVERVKTFHCQLVEVTGGEPLMQEHVHTLMRVLCDEGFEVLLETGGSLDIDRVDSRVRRIVDVKCPSSGMMKKNLWSNMRHLGHTDEVKFVIGTREDFDWALEVISEHGLLERCIVLMSTVFDVLNPHVLAGWILDSRINVRFQLQQHKYIWEPQLRGV